MPRKCSHAKFKAGEGRGCRRPSWRIDPQVKPVKQSAVLSCYQMVPVERCVLLFLPQQVTC